MRGERREDCGEILMSLVVIRDTDQLDTNARIIYSSYNVTECHRMSKIITPQPYEIIFNNRGISPSFSHLNLYVPNMRYQIYISQASE